jgi:RNA polymerase sigma-70 factor, ECF subfamily
MQSLAATLDPPDAILVDLARHGDNDAFAELVRRHQRRCIELATFFLRNPWDAEDQVQLAFLKAHIHLSQYHGEAEFATWLLRIVTNECFMFMRQRRRARFVYIDDNSRESEAPPVELSERSADPESALASCELKRLLRTEIKRVPPLLRNVIMLRDIQGLPMTAVAEALHISVPAAKSRLLRARTELRLRLKQRHDNTGNLSSLSRSGSPLKRPTHLRAMSTTSAKAHKLRPAMAMAAAAT